VFRFIPIRPSLVSFSRLQALVVIFDSKFELGTKNRVQRSFFSLILVSVWLFAASPAVVAPICFCSLFWLSHEEEDTQAPRIAS
jgi:ABC-type enterobactin transport system permease subunit